MKCTGALLLFCASVAIADEATAKKLLTDLEGKYVPVSMVKAGEPAPKDLLDMVSFTIKGDAFIVAFKVDGKDDNKTATIVLDTERKPIAIDLTPKDGAGAGKPMLGIISVEKDSVKLCWCDSKVRTERPTKFESTKENGHFLIEMKKAK